MEEARLNIHDTTVQSPGAAEKKRRRAEAIRLHLDGARARPSLDQHLGGEPGRPARGMLSYVKAKAMTEALLLRKFTRGEASRDHPAPDRRIRPERPDGQPAAAQGHRGRLADHRRHRQADHELLLRREPRRCLPPGLRDARRQRRRLHGDQRPGHHVGRAHGILPVPPGPEAAVLRAHGRRLCHRARAPAPARDHPVLPDARLLSTP